MASLTICGLDDDLKRRLRLEAARKGYSMEEAARQILRAALMTPDVDSSGLGSSVHGFFVEADAIDLGRPIAGAPMPTALSATIRGGRSVAPAHLPILGANARCAGPAGPT